MTRRIVFTRDEAEELVDLLESEVRYGHLEHIASELREAFGMMTREDQESKHDQLS